MAGALYAWSPILKEPDEKGRAQFVKLGETVTASDLDMTDEDFQYLVDVKAVREQPYPEELTTSPTPPSEYYKQLLAGAAEGSLSEDQSKDLSKMTIGFDPTSSSYLGPTSEGVEDVSGQTGSKPAASSTKG